MPRFGQHFICGGIGGHGVRINDILITDGAPGGASPLDADRTIFQHAGRIVTFDISDPRNPDGSPKLTQIDSRGANFICAGDGRWAAERVENGQYEWFGSAGTLFAPPLAFGQDGNYADKIGIAGGLLLNGRVLSTAPVENVQVLSHTNAIWTEEEDRTPRLKATFPIVTLDGRNDGARYAAGWLGYQNGYRYVLHPKDSCVGYAIPGQVFFRPDIRWTGNGFHVIWATTEADLDVQEKLIDLAEQRTDLRQPEPPPPPPPPPMTPNKLDVVRAVNDQFPLLLLANTNASCSTFRNLCAQRLNAEDPEWGELTKRPGEEQGPDGRAVDSIIYRKTQQVVDIISGAHNPPQPGTPAWQHQPKRPGNEWAVPGGDFEPPTGGTVTPTQLNAAMDTLRSEFQAELRKRRRVTLKSAHGRYLCIEPDGRVVADRDVVGSWEVLTEEQV